MIWRDRYSRTKATRIGKQHPAPDIQDAMLFLPRVKSGRDPITERELREIVAIADWAKQRRMWQKASAAIEM